MIIIEREADFFMLLRKYDTIDSIVQEIGLHANNVYFIYVRNK